MSNTDVTSRRKVAISEATPPMLAYAQKLRDHAHFYMMVAGLSVLVFAYFIPLYLELGLLVCLAFWGLSKMVRYPEATPEPEITAQNGKTGLYALGFEVNMLRPVYLTDPMMREHLLAIGTTGAGKTEFILSMVAQAMAQGSSAVLVDGKGDVKTLARMHAIARRLGVEEMLRVLNFGTNTPENFYFPGSNRQVKYDLSCSFVPFAIGDAQQHNEMMSSLMSDSGGGGGGGDMWKGRAESMMSTLLTVAHYFRDNYGMPLTTHRLTDMMPLDQFDTYLGKNAQGEPLKVYLPPPLDMHVELPHDTAAHTAVRQYLDSLPGYHAPNGRAKADEQHGYLTMQFTNILGLFNLTYGHIMGFDVGEINLYDILVNRRSLYVLIPTMEKSMSSCRNLGKVIVNQIRQAIGKTFGAGIQGERSVLLDARATNAETPVMVILDEYGTYAVEGFGDSIALVRAAGVSIMIAVQDWASLMRVDGKGQEAGRVWGNTNSKIFLKIEDTKETTEIAVKRGGEGYVLEQEGRETTDGVLGMDKAKGSKRYTKINRIDQNDLLDLEKGQFYFLTKSHMHRVQGIFIPDHDGQPWANAYNLKIARTIGILPPSETVVERLLRLEAGLGDLINRLRSAEEPAPEIADSTDCFAAAWEESLADSERFFPHNPQLGSLNLIMQLFTRAAEIQSQREQQAGESGGLSPTDLEVLSPSPGWPPRPATAPIPVACPMSSPPWWLPGDRPDGAFDLPPYVAEIDEDYDGEFALTVGQYPQTVNLLPLTARELVQTTAALMSAA